MRGTISRDDYLEAILLLSQESKRPDGAIRTPDIARHLHHSVSATHNAVDRLAKHKLIRLGRPKRIYLTEEGRYIAIKVREKHVFFKTALMRLGMDSESAERAACEIEHGVNDAVFELLKKLWADFSEKPCGELGFCPREHALRG
jgi:Mn-dependent DtxR family transcriptional regulator